MSDGQSIDEILARVRDEARLLKADLPAAPVAASRYPSRNLSALLPLPQPVTPIQPLGTLVALLVLSDEQFVDWAYERLLGRPADAAGLNSGVTELSSGKSRLNFLKDLLCSDEVRQRGASFPFLQPLVIAEKMLGRVLGLAMALRALPGALRYLSHRQQVESRFHRALATNLNNALRQIRENLVEFDKIASSVEQIAHAAEETADSAYQAAANAVADLSASRLNIIQQTEALRKLIDMAGPSIENLENNKQAVQQAGAIADHARDDLYVAIENHFRGSTEVIASRIRRYLPLFESLRGPTQGIVLDLGCGRGEWLSLLKQQGIAARGVDLNEVMVARTRALGLEVTAGDVLAYLRALPSGSLAAISAFHLVEHLSFKDLVTLFDESHRTLRASGLLLFETPNPENLVVGACNFYYDPTHRHPLPPQLLRMIAEARGFTSTRIIRDASDCQLDAEGRAFDPKGIEDWFKQPMDYALYARKADH